MTAIIVLDFETTGLSPDYGDRVTEVGAVVIDNGEIVNSFQSLMNAGVRLNSFIVQYTGITNKMIQAAPPVAEVIAQLAEFIGDTPLVAHNASFDRKFLDAELDRIGHVRCEAWACSMLIARRVFPEASSHSLGNLVRYADLPNDGVYHRALADATMTAHLWLRMQSKLCEQYELKSAPYALMQGLQKTPKTQVAARVMRLAKKLNT